MERIGLRWAAFILALVAAGFIEQAAAAEVTLLSTLAAHSVVEKARSGFEQKTSHHLVVKFDTAAGLKRDIESGIKFDAFLLTKDERPFLKPTQTCGVGTNGPDVKLVGSQIGKRQAPDRIQWENSGSCWPAWPSSNAN